MKMLPHHEIESWRERVEIALRIAVLLAQGKRVWLVQRNGQLSLLPDGPRIIGEEHPYAEDNGLDR